PISPTVERHAGPDRIGNRNAYDRTDVPRLGELTERHRRLASERAVLVVNEDEIQLCVAGNSPGQRVGQRAAVHPPACMKGLSDLLTGHDSLRTCIRLASIL